MRDDVDDREEAFGPTAYRAIPIEVLREYALGECDRTSLRKIADDTGVGRTTLYKFVHGIGSPHPRTRRAMALWYLRERANREENIVIETYRGALDVLLAGLPYSTRERARPALGAALGTVCEEDSINPPAALLVALETGSD